MSAPLSNLVQLVVAAVIVAIALAAYASRPQAITYEEYADRCLQPVEAFKRDIACMYHRNNTFRSDRNAPPQA